MTTYQSYAQRHSRQKSSSKQASVSPGKSTVLQMQYQQVRTNGGVDLILNNESALINPNTIGSVVGKLSDRVDSIEVKMTSLTNVVKLLQKYTESKDQQYEKQKENLEFKSQFQFIQNQGECKKSSVSLTSKGNHFEAIDTDINNRIKQFELLTKRMKSQLSAVQSLRIGLCRQSSQKFIETNCKSTANNTNTNPNIKIQNSQPRTFQLQDIQEMIENMQDTLRDQLNRKIQICINTFKALCNHQSSQSTKINRTMLQQQIHTLTLNFNKLENQQHKNVAFILAKVQEISKQVDRVKLVKASHDQVKLTEKKENHHRRNQSLTPKSNRSEKSISKSKKNPSASVNLTHFNLGQKTKLKQDQLKQAIRRKRQTKQKLKVK